MEKSTGTSGEDSASKERARPGSWPGAWLRAIRGLTSVSAARRAEVLRETQEGSQPTTTYYVLLGLSELIAGFALLINSDATLIGANVVAPLMTPIFGVSLGLMRSDFRLLRSALLSEFGGAALGVALCFLLGLLPFALDPSPALLAQTKPTLIDLMVAALAGFAGGLAMIDERVSPALPGVAIATALNPPIAAIGLCLAYGAYDGAWGAFILFFANVLAILAVGAVLFLAAGFVTREEIGSLRSLARRFSVAAIGLVVVTVLLSTSLLSMVTDLRTTRIINDELEAQISHEPGSDLVTAEWMRRDEGLDVLASVRTPRLVSPERVSRIQEELAKRLGQPVHLYVRCSLTRDVVASGSKDLRPWVSLEDTETRAEIESPERLLLQEAEQIAREAATTHPEIVLKDVELLGLAAGPVVIFSIENAREPSPALVGRFEKLLRQRLNRDDVRVVARTVDSRDITAKGRILFGEAHFLEQTPEEAEEQTKVENAVRASLEAVPNTFVTAVDAIHREGAWIVRAEASGPRALTPEEVKSAEQRSMQETGSSVSLSVRTRADLTVTSAGYEALGGNPAAEASR